MKEILVLCGCFPKEYEGEYLENTIGLAQIAADRLQKNIINKQMRLSMMSVFI